MKKRILTLTTMAIIVAVLSLFAVGCNKKLPIDGGGANIELKDAIAKVDNLFKADLNETFDKAEKYTLNFKIDYFRGGENITFDVKTFVNKNDSALTTMLVTCLRNETPYSNIFYSDNVLYVDQLDGDKMKIEQINLNKLFSTLFEDIASEAFTSRLELGLTALATEKLANAYAFEAVDVSGFISKFYDIVVAEFGNAAIFSEILGINPTIYSNDLIAMEDQKVTVLEKSIGNIQKLAEVIYGGKLVNGENKIPFSVRLYSIDFSVGAESNIHYEIDPSEYEEYSKATVAFSGNLKIKYPGRKITDLTGALSGADLSVPTFETNAGYSLRATLDAETGGITNLDARISLPSSIFSGIMTLPISTDPYISFIYSAEDRKVYLDCSSFGMDKVALDFTTSDFDDLFIIDGEDGTWNVDKVLAVLISCMSSETAENVKISLNEDAIKKLLTALNLEDIFDFEKIDISFVITQKGITNFQFRLDGPAFGNNENYVYADSKAITIALHKNDIGVVNKEEYITYSEIKDLGLTTSGRLTLPANTGIEPSNAINKLVYDLTGGRATTAFSAFTRNIGYSLIVNVNKNDYRDISVLINITSNPLGGDPNGKEGVLIGFNNKTKTVEVFIRTEAQGDYYAPYDGFADGIPMEGLSGKGEMCLKLTESFANMFKDPNNNENTQISLIRFALLNSGVDSVIDMMINFIGMVLTVDSGSVLTSASFNLMDNLKSTFSFANGKSATVTPNSAAISFGKIKATTVATVGVAYPLYGKANSVPAANVTFVSEAGSKILKLDLKIKPKFIGVKRDEQSGVEYLVLSVAGMPCDMVAKSLGSNVINEVFFTYNDGQYKDTLPISVSDMSSDFNLGKKLKEELAKATIKLGDGTEVKDIEINFEKDIVAELVEKGFANNTIVLNYYIQNNIGEKTNKTLNIRIGGFDQSDFSVIVNPNISMEFAAYGGIHPMNTANYPKYYNIASGNTTDTFDPSTCFALDWNLSTVLDQYKAENWVAYKDGMEVKVSVKGKNILGYEKEFKNIAVRMKKDDNIDESKITFDKSGFQEGLTYDEVSKILYINPWECPEFKLSLIQKVGYATTKINNIDGTPQYRDIKVEWFAIGGIVSLYTGESSEENPGTLTEISNSGVKNGYVWYRFGDNIGGYQSKKLKVEVVKREISEWGITQSSVASDTKKILDINPLMFRESMSTGLGSGIQYATISTNLIAKIKFEAGSAVGIYAEFVHNNLDYIVNVSTKVKIMHGSHTIEVDKNAEKFVLNNIDITLQIKEMLSVINSWSNKYSLTVFNFLGENALESLGDGLNYKGKELTCSAKIGSQNLDVIAVFTDKKVKVGDLTPDLGIYEDEVDVVNDGSKMIIYFDPYAKFDFKDLSLYPNRIRAAIGSETEYYKISWDISSLINAVDGQKDIYTGRANITIKMTIDRGYNSVKGVMTNYGVTYDIAVIIRSAVISANADGDKIGHAKTETDSLKICDIDQFRDLGIIEFPILTIRDANITVNNPLDLKKYAEQIAVRFNVSAGINDRWLKVVSWDISSAEKRYKNKFINEVTDTGDLRISAVVGTEYGGYQTVYFKLKIENGATSIKINEFTSIPLTFDIDSNQMIPTNDGAIEYVGTPKITFNPYIVNALKLDNYPQQASLLINNELESSDYQITGWELPSGATSDYRGADMNAFVIINDVFRLPVNVIVKKMTVASMKTAQAYIIKFNPYADGKTVLGDGDADVSWSKDGANVKYINTASDYKFLFTNTSNFEKSLNLSFSADDLPRNNFAFEWRNPILVGNDIGGYQPVPQGMEVTISRNMVEVNRIFAQPESSASTSYVCERTVVGSVGNQRVVYDFDTLPQMNNDKYPEPKELLISFMNTVTGIVIGETSNVPTVKYSQVLSNGKLANDENQSHTNGIFYTWADHNKNTCAKNPYYINVYNRIELLGYDYTFVENDNIVVSQNIEKWFDFIAEDAKAIFPFAWSEKYLNINVSQCILDMLSRGGIVLQDKIKSVYGDINDKVSIPSYIKFFYVDTIAGGQERKSLVERISTPGKYVAVFSINAKSADPYYDYTTVIAEEKKYFGTATFEFTVGKKDLYTANALQYKANGEILSSGVGVTNVKYTGAEYKLLVELVKKNIDDPDYVDFSQHGLNNDSFVLEFTKDVILSEGKGSVKDGATWSAFNQDTYIMAIGGYAVRTKVNRKNADNSISTHNLYDVTQVLFFNIVPFSIDIAAVTIEVDTNYAETGAVNYFKSIKAKDEKGFTRPFNNTSEYEIRTLSETGAGSVIDQKKIFESASISPGESRTIYIHFKGNYTGVYAYTLVYNK